MTSGFVYFFRKGEIYEIGQTPNLLESLKKRNPDEVLDVVRCSNYLKLELELYTSFQNCRIPQTNQFQFNFDQVESVHLMLRIKSQF